MGIAKICASTFDPKSKHMICELDAKAYAMTSRPMRSPIVSMQPPPHHYVTHNR